MTGLLALTLLLSFYELVLAQPEIYAQAPVRSWLPWPGLVATTLGGLLAYCARATAARIELALAALAWLAAAAGHLWLSAFSSGGWLHVAALVLPAGAGGLVGFCSVIAVRAFGDALVSGGAVNRFSNPFRLSAAGAGLILALYAFPLLGVLGRAGLLAASLAGLAALQPTFASRLGIDLSFGIAARCLTLSSAVAALVSVFAVSARTPPEVIGQHAGEVAFVLDTERGRHVVSSIQGGLVLFSNDVLGVPPTDRARFAEAMTHPALVAHPAPRAVLVISDGVGAIEREVLRWNVDRVHSLPRDPKLHVFAKQNLWLSSESAHIFAHPKVLVHPREASEFFSRARDLYDVIVADFGDPHSYIEAKYLTRHWFRVLRGRLRRGGILTLQATSPLRTPRAFASIVATLQAAGFAVLPYRAPLPTLGEWGFVLAADAEHETSISLQEKLRGARNFPSGTAFVTRATLPGLFAAPPFTAAISGSVSYLYDQSIVEVYQSEERSFAGL